MKYVTLIELSLQHDYYTDLRCRDFTIVASAETDRLLRNHRCITKTSSDTVRVLCPVDDAGSAFLPFLQGDALRFSLVLSNPEFALFTDLTGLAPAENQATPLFSNSGETAQLLLSTDSGATRTPAVFANVELALPATTSSSPLVPASYYVRFAAKQARWAFYCVTDLAASSDSELHIVDASPSGTTDVMVFSDTNRRSLDVDPDPADSTAAMIVTQHPTLRCIRMTSDELVTCRQQPRKYLELWRGAERLVGPLPNPSLRQAAREDLLFQVVKYRTQPFSTQ